MGGTPGQTYNIGGSNEVRNIDTAEIICNILNKKVLSKPSGIKDFNELIEFVPDRPGHDLRYAINSSKMKQCFSWSPQENFDSGLEKTVEWYVDNKVWWQDILEKKYSLTRLGSLK